MKRCNEIVGTHIYISIEQLINIFVSIPPIILKLSQNFLAFQFGSINDFSASIQEQLQQHSDMDNC